MFKTFVDKFQKKVEYRLSGFYINLGGFRITLDKTFPTELAAWDFLDNEVKPNCIKGEAEIIKVETTQSLVYKKKWGV